MPWRTIFFAKSAVRLDWKEEGALSGLVLTISSFALAWPIFGAKYLPFVDYPQHIAAIAAIHGASDPRFAPYFVVDLTGSQYLLIYFVGSLLATPFGVDGAGRFLVWLSAASLPWAVAWFLREHGRPALLGTFAAAIALHIYVFWGFLNYVAGMSLAIAALAGLAGFTKRGGWKRGVLCSVLVLLCFYAHAQAYLWLVASALIQWLAMLPRLGWRLGWWRALASLLIGVPSAVGAFLWVWTSGVLEHGEAGLRSGHASQMASVPPVFIPIHDTLRSWLDHSFGMYVDGGGEWIACSYFAILLFLIAIRGKAEKRPVEFSHAPELVLIFTFAAYLFAPFSYRLIEPINHRFLPLAFALLPGLGPIALTPKQFRFALISSIFLSLETATIHYLHFMQSDEEVGELEEALAHTQPGKRLLGLIFEPTSNVIRLPIHLHEHQYYQATVGGLACFSFVEFPKSPLKYRDGVAPPPFPPRFEWEPWKYDHSIWGEAFDYWLIRHSPHQNAPNVFRFSSRAPMPVLVAVLDRWTLYARKELASISPR